MNTHIERIRKLVALQHVDDDIYAIEQELKAAPEEVEELARRFAEQEEQRNHILDKLQHLREQQKRIEQDIEGESSRIKKSKSKLMQVENDREYQAVVREVDNMERQSRSREEERVVIQEAINLQEGNLRDMDESWGSLKAELEVKRENLDARLEEARKKYADLENVRSDTCGEVPEPVLKRYEFIRRRLNHPVIVPVDSGVCSGCHIAIPPQVFIELQRGKQILSCPNCQRLIYWDQHFTDPVSKPAPKPVQHFFEEEGE